MSTLPSQNTKKKKKKKTEKNKQLEKNKEGSTTLITVAANGHEGIVELSSNKEAKVDIVDKEGTSALNRLDNNLKDEESTASLLENDLKTKKQPTTSDDDVFYNDQDCTTSIAEYTVTHVENNSRAK